MVDREMAGGLSLVPSHSSHLRSRLTSFLHPLTQQKDALMETFYTTGHFTSDDNTSPVERIEITLLDGLWREIGGSMCWLAPFWVGLGIRWVWTRVL